MIVTVQFRGTSKTYEYNTRIDNLIIGGWYDILVDNYTTYNSFVKILGCRYGADKRYRTITKAKLIDAPRKPHPYHKIYVNSKKKVITVVWHDGSHTVVKCQDGDDFDIEKGIAMCFMKRVFDNRGCYNDAFKDTIEISEFKK